MMMRALEDARLRGRIVYDGDFERIPESVLKESEKSTRSGYESARNLTRALEAYITHIQREAILESETQHEEFEAANELLEQLVIVTTHVCDQRETEGTVNQQDLEFSRAFHTAKGWAAPVTFLMQHALPMLMQDESMARTRSRYLTEIARQLMMTLRDLALNVPELGEVLGARDDLICLLMNTLTTVSIYESAGLLCEELLCGRRDQVFELRKVSNLPMLVRDMNAIQLLLLCRLVSLIALDPHERAANNEGKHLKSFALLDQRQNTTVAELCGRDLVAKNHLQLIRDCPEFLPRLIQLLGENASSQDEKMLWLAKDSSRWRPVSAVPAVVVDGDSAVTTAADFVINQMATDSTAPSGRSSASPSVFSAGAKVFAHMARHLKQATRRLVSIVRLSNSNNVRDSEASEGTLPGKIFSVLKSIVSSVLHPPGRESTQRTSVNSVTQSDPLLTPEGDHVDDEDVDEMLQDGPDDGEAEEEDESAGVGEYILNPQFWENEVQRELWLLSQRLEIAYVLCTLCVGPHKKLAQDTMTRLTLISAVTSRFDLLSWDPVFRPQDLPPSHRLHGAGCECNPHGAFKSQLLRLVHNYCDRECDNRSNKSTLFSTEELKAQDWDHTSFKTGMQKPFGWEEIHVEYPARNPLLTATNALPLPNLLQLLEEDAVARSAVVGLPDGCAARHGLAWRISAVLISSNKPQYDSSLRFWIFAALEALLRGSSAKVKMMVCCWGILRAVISSILSEGPAVLFTAEDEDKSGVLQTCFDLLGELVKDNPTALAWVCGSPCDMLGAPHSESVMDDICRIALDHLVDGNVFLRAVALTVKRSPTLESVIPARKWVLEENAVRISKGLWTVVSVEEVSQENLCCLNTSVVLLTFARWENALADFVQQVISCDFDPQNTSWDDGESAPVRFRKLLWFWRCYYSCRAVDRKSLEHSSGIKFEELEKTVSALCERNGPEGSLLTGNAVVHIPYIGNTLAVTAPASLTPWGSF